MRNWLVLALAAGLLTVGAVMAQDAAGPGAGPAPDAAPPELAPGAPAPDFRLNDQHGDALRLSEVAKDRWVVLAFFPKAMTPG